MKSLLPLAFFLLLPLMALADMEKEVLAEINLARSAPQRYAGLLAQRFPGSDQEAAEAVRFLIHASPLPALERSGGLRHGALLHVQSQGPLGTRGHGSGSKSPFARIERFGEWSGAAGENICYGRRDARGIVCALIVDRGVLGNGHRKNLFSPNYCVAGVAYGPHRAYGTMCVIAFAGRYQERGERVASL